MTKVVPQKLPPNQFDHFYLGGERIGTLRNGPGGPMRPEEWIGSTTTRFGEKSIGLSTLENGELLVTQIQGNPKAWLGDEHFKEFGASTEILVKLLDPSQRLPVHFHPNRSFSRKHLGLAHGKTEAWIILDAPKDAQVGLGFSKTASKVEITKLVEEKDSDALLNLLKKFPVKTGDSILVPAGVPHAIDAGIFLLELQEPSDLSVLLEWNNFAVDGVKDGHLNLGFDCVLDALRYTPLAPEEIKRIIISRDDFGLKDEALFSEVAMPHFRADYLSGGERVVESGFSILLILNGEGKINFTNSAALSVIKGDAVVIPATAGEWTLEKASGIVSRPPLPKFATLAE
jgi:mannose-6-phosphate isomerase